MPNVFPTWFDYVPEAKLVTSSGLAISVASEFVENQPGRNYENQDCEWKDFISVAKKNQIVFSRAACLHFSRRSLSKKYSIRYLQAKWMEVYYHLKRDRALKSFTAEVNLLEATAGKQIVFRRNKTESTA